ncbi:DUF3558 domain-containing protein [Streptomyces phaeoluteigriseus]|uniref:DUF3558 domain-containing protein n=1 Tax=Streptomyces phaeoluteigriseus TaxID=114686 RepID=A0A1V6MKF7_9ACTN|nr:DUF3558 family protein [Streptomyces phaeoluteigriseus]OQD52858.1 DUF3558 domain-containing protein [Streptomyces phaeoluteigriseus]
MSEGTMQRRAQRDDQRARRTMRTGGLNRLLAAAAAVPVMLIAAGCSSGSDSGSGDDAAARKSGGASASTSPSAEPTVQAAAYAALPEACGVLSKKTLTALVPKAPAKGKEGASSDTAARASCSWSSLDNNGVKGSQFRWLNVSLVRFETDAASSGEQQAQEYYAKQIQDVAATAGAKNAKSQAVAGTGDQATTVRYDLKKSEGAFKQQTVVSRVENVVVTVDYNGAGLAGEKTPDAAALVKSAELAAKEAVAAVQAANGEGGGVGSSSPTPSKPSSKSPSASASASASPSASASASAAGAKKS